MTPEEAGARAADEALARLLPLPVPHDGAQDSADNAPRLCFECQIDADNNPATVVRMAVAQGMCSAHLAGYYTQEAMEEARWDETNS